MCLSWIKHLQIWQNLFKLDLTCQNYKFFSQFFCNASFACHLETEKFFSLVEIRCANVPDVMPSLESISHWSLKHIIVWLIFIVKCERCSKEHTIVVAWYMYENIFILVMNINTTLRSSLYILLIRCCDWRLSFM